MVKLQILSASHIGTFKACPMRYNLRYILGLQPIEETESLRYGSNWHKIQQIVNLKPGDSCPDCKDKIDRRGCILCGGNGIIDDGGMDAVIRCLDSVYSTAPISKTPEEAEIERIILLYSLIGYNWYYQDKQTEEKIVAQEINFRLPLTSPISKRKLPNIFVDGRIDKIISTEIGKIFIKELKSTGDLVAPDSDYWKHLTLDTQTLLYIWAARQLGYPDAQLLYDVWHKPGIRPKALSQADSKSFVTPETDEVDENGNSPCVYAGQRFSLAEHWQGHNLLALRVNSQEAEVEPGKKEGAFAIRETPEMFGARLLQDITERPEFYFCTKEIARTDADIEQFGKELFNMYQTIRTMKKTNAWWCNEHACEASYKCAFLNVCYNHIQVDPQNPPQGFECRFDKSEKKEGV